MLLSTESVALRTLDALHVALALSGSAKYVITFEARLASWRHCRVCMSYRFDRRSPSNFGELATGEFSDCLAALHRADVQFETTKEEIA